MTPVTRYADNGGVRVAYETFGDLSAGEPLLLIMGLDFQMVWWPEGFIEQLVEQGFAVVRFDNRDTGLSTHFDSVRRESPWRALAGRSKPAYTGLDMLNDALAVMDAVGWTSAHLLGGSMGAGLAQSMALHHPERVRSLTSVMGVPVDASALKAFSYIKFGIFKDLRKLMPGTTRESQIDFLVEIYRAVASPGFPFPEVWAREVAAISHERSPRNQKSTQRHLAAGRAIPYPPLSTITAPTLVIHGENDPLIKTSGGRDTAARIPGATFVSYPGMGHNLPEELWSQVVAQVVTVSRKAQT